MGVPKLWELVQPSGNYVELKDLEGLTLAIDASIWVYSFLRAFKDERGDPAENAHLLGFFWRICKLLQLRIKPVFVFDGDIPYLKQRTINERRKRKENSLDQIEKNQRKMVLLRTIKEQMDRARGIIDESQFDHLFNDLDDMDDSYDFDKEDEVDEDLVVLDNKQQKKNNGKINSLNIDELFPNTVGSKNSAFVIEDDSDDEYLNNNNDPRNVPERTFTIEDEDYIGEYDATQFVHNFDSEEIDQQVFSQLPQDIQLEVLSQMKVEKRIKDKISLLTPPKTPIDFSKHQMDSLLQKGKLTRKINEVRDSIGSEMKGVSSDGDTVFLFHKNTPNSQTPTSTPFSTPSKSLSDRIVTDSTTSTTKRSHSSSSLQNSPPKNDRQPISSILNQISSNNLNSNNNKNNNSVDKTEIYSKLGMIINRQVFLEPKSPSSSKSSQTQQTEQSPPSSSKLSLPTSRLSLSSPNSSKLSLSSPNSSKLNMDNSLSYSDQDDSIDISSKTNRNLLDELFGSSKKNTIRNSKESDDSSQTSLDGDDDDIPDFNRNIVENDDFDLDFDNSKNNNKNTTSNNNAENKFSTPTFSNKIVTPTIATSKPTFKIIQSKEKEEDLSERINTIDQDTDDIDFGNSHSNLDLDFNEDQTKNSFEDDDIEDFVNKDIKEKDQEDINHSKTVSPIVSLNSNLENNKKINKFDDLDIFDIGDDNTVSEEETQPTTTTTTNTTTVTQTTAIDIDENSNNKLVDDTPVDLDSIEDITTTKLYQNAPVFDNLNLRNLDQEYSNKHSTQGTPSKVKPIFEYFTSKESETLEKELELEKIAATNKLSQQIRSVKSIDDDILRECHDLLSLFGIPYITSPTEAEAQCAELFNLGLVDGVVTEDSDVLLFGSTNLIVYRHLFQKPERFMMSDIEAKIGLNRDDLINLALLLGCDYTTGVKGVGIVNAMEIIGEFDDLKEFADFIKKPLTVPKDDDPDHSEEMNTKRYQFKSLLKNVKLPESFPSEQVKMAFYHPDVNSSKDSFVWNCPDLDSLRKLTFTKFGWKKDKTDNILLPILRIINQTPNDDENNNNNSFMENRLPTKFKSKRLSTAIERLIGIKSGQPIQSITNNNNNNKSRRTKKSTPTNTPKKKQNLIKDNDQNSEPKDIDLEDESLFSSGPKDIDLDEEPIGSSLEPTDNGNEKNKSKSKRVAKRAKEDEEEEEEEEGGDTPTKKKKISKKVKSPPKKSKKKKEVDEVDNGESNGEEEDEEEEVDSSSTKKRKSKTPPKKSRK